MDINTVNAAPYTIYRYFEDIHEEECKLCHEHSKHLLLRYRNYFFTKHPIIPTNTQFFLICRSCNHMTELDGEGIQMPYVFRTRQQKPIAYTKYDILDLVSKLAPLPMMSEEEFEYNVNAHLKDMKNVIMP